MLLVHKKYHVSVFLTCLQLLILWITHNILITRLPSWFGIHSFILKWFKSYLSSCFFQVKCNDCFSSCHTCLCCVSVGSVLGTLIFILYTTPLTTISSSLSFNRHLYADDTQLFFFFYPHKLNSLSQTNISALSKSCYSHVRELRCIHPYLDFKTASTISTAIVDSKHDCCTRITLL